MSFDKKTTFGATVITPITDFTTHPTTIADNSSNPDAFNPYSAFYSHPPARRSMQDNRPPRDDRLTTSTSTKQHLALQDVTHDLESASRISHQPTSIKFSTDTSRTTNKECTAWPSKATLLEKQRAATRTRSKGTWGRLRCRWVEMEARKRLWIKIVLALVVIAAAVGLGVGISRAVGGQVWIGDGRSKPIAHES